MSHYENFVEVGSSVTEGNSIFHVITYSHPGEDCLPWQHGIHNLCEWLDQEGFLVVEVPPDNECARLPYYTRQRILFGKFLIRLGELIATFSILKYGKEEVNDD